MSTVTTTDAQQLVTAESLMKNLRSSGANSSRERCDFCHLTAANMVG